QAAASGETSGPGWFAPEHPTSTNAIAATIRADAAPSTGASFRDRSPPSSRPARGLLPPPSTAALASRAGCAQVEQFAAEPSTSTPAQEIDGMSLARRPT